MLPDIHHVCWRADKPTSETCWQKTVVGYKSQAVILHVYMLLGGGGCKHNACARVCVCVCVPTSKGSQQDLLVKGHGALACAAHHIPHCLIDGKSGE